MITPSYSPAGTQIVLPKLALDFTTGTLDSRVTFVRTNSIATRYNASGYIETVGANLPRFDYNPITSVIKGLLIEEQRVNILRSSQAFTTASSNWADSNVTRGTSGTSPDGTTNAILFISTAVDNIHSTYNDALANRARATNTTYTLSAFVKPSGYNYATVSLSGTNSSIYAAVTFELTGAGSVTQTNVGAAGGTLTDYGISQQKDGWYRVYVVGQVNQANGYDFVSFGPNGTFTPNIYGLQKYTGDASSGGYLWGIQDEAGAFPTSYIPTVTGSVTRSPDIATLTSTNFSSWWTATTGATVVRAEQYLVAGTRPWVQFDDNTADNIIAFRGNTTNPEFYVKATTDQATIDAGTIAANIKYNFAAAWNTDDCAALIDAGSAVTDTSVTIPTVTQARLGSDGTNYLNGWLQSVRYWPQRLTNAEIQAFSK